MPPGALGHGEGESVSVSVNETNNVANNVRKTSRAARGRLTMVLLAVVAIALVLQFAKKPLASAGVLTPVQHYVAMDFPHPDQLPGQFFGDAPMAFEFRIVNHEPNTERVHWVVVVAPAGHQTYEVASGSPSIGAGRSSVVHVKASPRGHWKTATVEIEAPGQAEAPLTFHISELAGTVGD